MARCEKEKECAWSLSVKVYLVTLVLMCCACAAAFSERRPDPLCGPKSVCLILGYFGIPSDLDEACQLSGYQEEKGTSLAGLQQALKMYGIQSVGVKATLRELREFGLPAIIHLWGGHFVVLKPTQGIHFLVCDPSLDEKYRAVSEERLTEDYSGFALLTSREPISVRRKDEVRCPDVRFDRYTSDFGVRGQSTPIEILFPFENVGQEQLSVSRVRATCGCASARVSTNRLSRGEKGVITIVYDPSGRVGFQRERVYVHTNDPVTPVVVLEIYGVITPLRVWTSPSVVHFGKVRRGSSAEQAVKVLCDRNLTMTRLESSLPFVTTRVTVLPEAESGWRVYEINTLLADYAPVGDFQGSLTVYAIAPYAIAPRETKVEIAVRGSVAGEIEASPRSVYLGYARIRDKRDVVSQAKVVSVRGAPFGIRTVWVEGIQGIRTHVTPFRQAREYLVEIVWTPTGSGEARGMIVLEADHPNQPEVVIPVIGYISTE